MKRPTSSAQLSAEARCRSCTWHKETANAQAIGALHHDHEHHQVVVIKTVEIIYGDASTTHAPGGPQQTAIAL